MSGSAQLLSRQVAVLQHLAVSGPQPFNRIGQELRLPACTVVRLLRAMVAADLVRRLPDRRYLLGPGALGLAMAILGHTSDSGLAEPVLRDLARQTGASASYWTLDGPRLILTAKCELDGGFHYIDRFAHREPEDRACT